MSQGHKGGGILPILLLLLFIFLSIWGLFAYASEINKTLFVHGVKHKHTFPNPLNMEWFLPAEHMN